jgi:hypothetical protein
MHQRSELLWARTQRVLWQRALAISEHSTVSEAIQDTRIDLPSDACWVVLSFRGRQYELNASSALMWEALSMPQSVAGLVGVLRICFEENGLEAEKVAMTFVEAMQLNGLVREHRPENGG